MPYCYKKALSPFALKILIASNAFSDEFVFALEYSE